MDIISASSWEVKKKEGEMAIQQAHKPGESSLRTIKGFTKQGSASSAGQREERRLKQCRGNSLRFQGGTSALKAPSKRESCYSREKGREGLASAAKKLKSVRQAKLLKMGKIRAKWERN